MLGERYRRVIVKRNGKHLLDRTGVQEDIFLQPSSCTTSHEDLSTSLLSSSGVRFAIYDTTGCVPEVVDLTVSGHARFIEEVPNRVYRLCREQGGDIPFIVIREIIENLIHADFRDPVVSIMDSGHTVMVSDHGPGIRHKEKALLPGYSTSSSDMRRYIRGVGSGFPVAQETLVHLGGSLRLEDNLEGGLVVTLTTQPNTLKGEKRRTGLSEMTNEDRAYTVPLSGSGLEERLCDREKKVLLLLAEMEEGGPSAVSRELAISLSTAYRDLAKLEKSGYILSRSGGKRTITEKGIAYMNEIFSGKSYT